MTTPYRAAAPAPAPPAFRKPAPGWYLAAGETAIGAAWLLFGQVRWVGLVGFAVGALFAGAAAREEREVDVTAALRRRLAREEG